MKKSLLLFTLLVSALTAACQFPEIGLFGGGSTYMGDLNPGRPFANINPAFGLVYRHNYNQRYAFRANLLRGNVEGYDSQSKDLWQVQRNLNFKSSIIEASGIFEFNFLPYAIGEPDKFFSPYVFAGLGLFKFNPKAQLGDDWVALQPLGTEGQGTTLNSKKNYKLVQLSMPFGLGFKLNLTRKFGIALEWGLRKTSTDYLDDVSTIYYDKAVLAAQNGAEAALLSDRRIVAPEGSYNHNNYQRGNSKNKDWYSFGGLMLMYNLKGKDKCHLYLPN